MFVLYISLRKVRVTLSLHTDMTCFICCYFSPFTVSLEWQISHMLHVSHSLSLFQLYFVPFCVHVYINLYRRRGRKRKSEEETEGPRRAERSIVPLKPPATRPPPGTSPSANTASLIEILEFPLHEEHYSACEGCCIMSTENLEGVFQNLTK